MTERNATLQEAGGIAALAGKVALVTGGTSGIGQGCCVALGIAGAYVVVTGRERDKEREGVGGAKGGNETVAQIVAAGGKGHFAVLDVTVEADWVRVLGEIKERFGKLNVLLNNAGRSVRGGLQQATLEDVEWEIAINIGGAMMGTNLAWPLLAKEGGVVLYTNSTGGLRGSAGSFAYPASKAAMLGLARAAAEDGKPVGIRSISLHPGGTWSPGTAWVGDYRSEAEYLDSIKKSGTIPLGVPAYPADIGTAVVYLASDAARHITGIMFNIDGGGSAR
jgi:3alpha(or 20beta)-hydroxysteroid dehydrogenase